MFAGVMRMFVAVVGALEAGVDAAGLEESVGVGT